MESTHTSPRPEEYEPKDPPQPIDKDTEIFDPRITTYSNISDIFCIFTEEEKSENIPDVERNNNDIVAPVEAYTDGPCTNNGSEDALTGAGIFFPNKEYCTVSTNCSVTDHNRKIRGRI